MERGLAVNLKSEFFSCTVLQVTEKNLFLQEVRCEACLQILQIRNARSIETVNRLSHILCTGAVDVEQRQLGCRNEIAAQAFTFFLLAKRVRGTTDVDETIEIKGFSKGLF